MDYEKTYNKLIAAARTQQLDGYYETHHIVPRAEGGSDDKTNLVNLTARQHYIAHLLLAKIYNDVKMYSALVYMRCGNKFVKRNFKFNSRLYEKMREEFAKKVSNSRKGKHHYNNGKISVYCADCPNGFVPGRMPYSEEALANMKLGSQSEKQKAAARANFQKAAAMNKGKTFSEEHRRRIGESVKGEKNGMYGKHLSEETKQKMSKALKGRPKSPATRAKMKANCANKSPVIQYTKDGTFVAEYETMTAAYQATGIRPRQIRRVILGTSSYGDFIWKYKEKRPSK